MPISSWSTTASSNATADSASGIVWSEGQAPSSINDSARAMMAEIRKDYANFSLFSFRNKLINGNFAINQRAVSGTVTLAASAYGHDRWKAGASGCTYTFSTSGADTAITITAGSLMQVVEGANVEGGVYTLSWTGTTTGRVAISGGSTSGSYAASPITTSSATGGQTITVEFSTGTLGKVQLETGTVATAFERRPRRIEEALCLRYYESSYSTGVAPAATGTSGGCMGVAISTARLLCGTKFTAPKRSSSPTVTIFNPSTGTGASVWAPGIESVGISSVAGVGNTSFQYLDTTSGLTTGRPYLFHYTVSDEL